MEKTEQEIHLTNKQTKAVILREALGFLSVLAIGIDDYDKTSGFNPLKTCSNDALEVQNAFLDVWQLNADKGRVWTLTSEGSPVPSKGEIIKAINRLASMIEPNDRLLLYYSGHGHRIKDGSGTERFYIVPQDAYDDTDPEALIDFHKVVEILKKSEAKQQILIIDACMSGPDITGKKILPAKYSAKFLAEYMRKTKGITVVSSSTADQPSYSQSPNPKLSLFTYYFIRALRGDEEALDESMLLTINSLYDYITTKVERRAKSYQKDQSPSIDIKASGVIILGNFAQSIISPESFDLEGYPISEIVFRDWQKLDVRDVLTQIKRWSAYNQEYLAGKVNDNLGEYLEEKFGAKAATLRRRMGFSASEVGVEENIIRFPGGIYTAEYIAQDKTSGKVILSLGLESEWFSRPSEISKIVDCLEMVPEEMVLELINPINPESLIPGLEARGWEIVSQLSKRIEAETASYTLIAEISRITFKGFTPQELFGDKSDKKKSAIASNALALVAGKVNQ
jgi:hypothetical protein